MGVRHLLDHFGFSDVRAAFLLAQTTASTGLEPEVPRRTRAKTDRTSGLAESPLQEGAEALEPAETLRAGVAARWGVLRAEAARDREEPPERQARAGSAGQPGSAGSSGTGGAHTGTGGAAGIPGCGTLPNTATAVAPSSLTSILTDYAGGTVSDGVYVLTAVQQTEAIMPGEEYQRTLSIEAGATAFEWAINDVNVAGSGTLDLAGTFTLDGSSFNFSGTCAPGNNYRYTANGNQISLYFVPTPTVEKIYHFQLSQ